VLEDWLGLREWARLDSAVCCIPNRALFQNALKVSQLQHEVKLKGDRGLVWLANRSISIRSLQLRSAIAKTATLEQCNNSLTIRNLVQLTVTSPGNYLFQLLPLCNSIEKLDMPNLSDFDGSQLKVWCPKLTSLRIRHNCNQLYHTDTTYRLGSMTCLQTLSLPGIFYCKQLVLPVQLKTIQFCGSADDSTLSQALKPCSQLHTVILKMGHSYDPFDWSTVLEVLPSSIVVLELRTSPELRYIVDKFTHLTDLSIYGCENITSATFDQVFLLPYLRTLLLTSSTPCTLETLSSTIVCPSMESVILSQIFVARDMILARCPNMKHFFSA